MTQPVRLGIIGCGEVAQIIHLPTLHHLRDLFAVTAICDVSERVREQVGARWGVAARLADHRALLDRADVDAVLVANPHPFHAETARDAMRAGKHVMVEKPLCISLAEADMLIAEEQASGRVVQVGYMRRHAPAFAEAKRLVADMRDIRLARVHDVIGRNALIIAEIADVVRPSDLPASAAETLRTAMRERTAEAIGDAPESLQSAYGLLLGLSSHDLSAMRDLLGRPARVLYAASRGPEGRAVSAAFDYGGYVCQFETLTDAIPRFDAHIEVYAPDQVVRVEYDTPYVRNIPGRIVTTDVGGDGLARRTVRHAWRDSFEIEWRDFHANVTANRRPRMSLSDALEDLELFAEMVRHMRASS